jgi:hypothetical protein
MTLDNYRNNWLRLGFTEADYDSRFQAAFGIDLAEKPAG